MNLYKGNEGFLLGLFGATCDGKALTANTVDASVEKHKPAYKIEGNEIIVTVGDVMHPHTQEHYIDYIILETENGYQIKKLDNAKDPVTSFTLVDDKPINVYAYCNLHGLWKTEIK